MQHLVTGASGFVGQALCAELAGCGESVRALSRSRSTLACGIRTHALDLSSTCIDTAMLSGIDVVYHLAAIAHQRAADEAYEQVNHLATLALARAASRAGVKHFVFLSSVKAMGPAPGGAGSATERGELDVNVTDDAYGRSKWLAEEGLRREFTDASMQVIIIRPALVYAAEAKGNLAALLRAIRWGLPRPPAQGGRSMIARQDLVELLCGVVNESSEGVATWIATDGQRYSTRRIYDALRSATGKTLGLSWCPTWLWRFVIICIDIGRGRPGCTWDKLFGEELYSSALVQTQTSWRPQLQLETALADMSKRP